MSKKVINENEGCCALVLSILFNLSPDTATFILEHAGTPAVNREYALNKMYNFFNSKLYEKKLNAAIMKAEYVPQAQINKKLNIRTSECNHFVEQVERAYAEFGGLLKLGLISWCDSPTLCTFMMTFEPYTFDNRRERLQKLLLDFYSGKIEEEELRNIVHMTPNRLDNLVGYSDDVGCILN